MKILLHVWCYECCDVVQDLAVVPQGGILAHVIAKTAPISNCDEAFVRVTRVCSVGKLFGPEIMVLENEKSYMVNYRTRQTTMYTILLTSCSSK